MKKTEAKQNLSHKVVKGTMWLFAFQILDNVLGFIRIIILARLLSPTAFGLVGAAWLILQIINTFTVTGFGAALIQKQKIDEYLNVVWTFTLLRGILIFTSIVLFSPLIGTFFNSNEVIPILQAISLTVLISGFGNIGMIYFQKELDFQKQFRIQLTQNTVDFIITLIFAFILQNVWAIVIGTIANSITGCILSYIISKYRPRFEWNTKKLKEMNHYGKWIGGSTILQFLYSQGDDILVGRILGVTSLGYYQLAYRISNLPATQITHIISTVMFPAYSKIQNSMDKMRDVYLRNLQITAFLSLYVGTMIICFAKDFTNIFLGEKWLPIILSMQLLTIWGLVRSIGATTGPVWQAIGKPKLVTIIQSIQVIILFSLILPLTYSWGINGTSLAVVISSVIPNIITIFLISKTLEINIMRVLIELIYPFIATIPILIWFVINNIYFTDSNLFIFVISAILLSILYLSIVYILHKFFNYQVFSNIASLFPKFYFLKKL